MNSVLEKYMIIIRLTQGTTNTPKKIKTLNNKISKNCTKHIQGKPKIQVMQN